MIGGTGTIYINDLVFGIHAFMLASVQLTQIFIYDRGNQKGFSLWTMGLLAIELATVGAILFHEVRHPMAIDPYWSTIKVLGYWKTLITAVKYLPQVYLNWKRQSTVGWSLTNVLLDFTGGMLSLI